MQSLIHRIGFMLILCVTMASLCHAATRTGPDLFDPRSSDGYSGGNTPREFFLPPMPTYDKHDPNEFDEYEKKVYSPYAQLRVTHPLHVGETILPTGYYLVELELLPPEQEDPNATSSQNTTNTTTEEDEDEYCLIVKRGGNMELFLHVESSRQKTSEERKAEKKANKKNKRKKPWPLASVVIEPGNPIQPEVVHLEYCDKKTCHRSGPLQPGLLK